jgi:hypothetical protein
MEIRPPSLKFTVILPTFYPLIEFIPEIHALNSKKPEYSYSMLGATSWKLVIGG